MIYEDTDRERVVEYLQETFDVTRDALEEGVELPAHMMTLAESLDHVKKWKREKTHSEL